MGMMPHDDNPRQSNEHRVAHHHVLADHVRVVTVQYQQREISSFDEFKQHVTYFVKSVSEYRADFILFPEFFTSSYSV